MGSHAARREPVERAPGGFQCASPRVAYLFTAKVCPPSADGVVSVVNNRCRAEGSGFIAEPGYVVTNAHVVAGESRPVVIERGRLLPAEVVEFKPKLDIAVLRVGDL